MSELFDREYLIEKFLKVKQLGFVKSNRPSNTGIGKTFEDYMGVDENNVDEPDLAGFEIKSHREIAQTYITLFTKAPSFPKGANAYLRDKFGDTYERDSSLKKLHTSIFADRPNSYLGKYSFKLRNDRSRRKIIIEVYSLLSGELLDNSCGYDYDDIKVALIKKLNNLLYVSAQRKFDNDGAELFYFNYAEIYLHPSIENFLDLLDNGQIMYDIRMGSYQSGANYGKPHDHGSGFRIRQADIVKLYKCKEIVSD